MNGRQILEFVGLRPKSYSYTVWNPTSVSSEAKKCKGVKKNVVKRITYDDYKKCLFSGDPQLRTMSVIRSRNHELYTEIINKTALSANDDKRIICKDMINTYAIGHKLFRNLKPTNVYTGEPVEVF